VQTLKPCFLCKPRDFLGKELGFRWMTTPYPPPGEAVGSWQLSPKAHDIQCVQEKTVTPCVWWWNS